MIDNKEANSYLLVPPPFQDKYGTYILETCYDGYGNMGGYDVYNLVAEWNRGFLNADMLQKPEKTQWRKEDEAYYYKAVERFDRTVKVLEKYKLGASDKEMETFCKEERYCYYSLEWKRNIGIDIACYDSQNSALPFPIKITSKPMNYDVVEASKSDPDQGWE